MDTDMCIKGNVAVNMLNLLMSLIFVVISETLTGSNFKNKEKKKRNINVTNSQNTSFENVFKCTSYQQCIITK